MTTNVTTFSAAIERGLTDTAHRVAKSDAEFTVELRKVMDDPAAMNAWQVAGFNEARTMPGARGIQRSQEAVRRRARMARALRDAFIVATR